MKFFTSVHDVQDIDGLIAESLQLKKSPLQFSEMGRDKTIVLLFFNPSLRTRLSTQKAALNLGMHVISMNAAQGWKIAFEENIIMDGDHAEHIKEAAPVLSKYGDIIAIRTFPGLQDRESDYSDEVLSSFVKYATVPVISLESAIRHPLQSLADLMTIRERESTELPRIVLTWAPHPRALPQAVPNSFSEWVIAAGYQLTIACPKGLELNTKFTKGAQVTDDQKAALEGADFVYAKNWSSYSNYGKVTPVKESWTIDEQKMTLTNNAGFMHCLPVRRNVVVSDQVLDSDSALVIEQANNRTFAAQAVIKRLLESIVQ